MCPRERAGAQAAPPDAPGRLAIALCSMRPPALLPVPFASASGSPGVPESSTLTYTAKGKVSGLEPKERWEHEEHSIGQVLGNSIPDEVFLQIKDTESVKDAWNIAYEDRTAAVRVPSVPSGKSASSR
jgi:hypothetical protein